VLALALLLVPQLALALGLGDIRLNSRLNSPLDAEIELIGVEPDELASLRARLASRETFARYGLEWPAMLSTVTVTPIKTPGGGDALRVRSTEPVTEPFLSLLIEVNWSRGRLVREYTVLIDPPAFAPEAAQGAGAPVAAPSTGTGERQGDIARPAPQAEPEPAPIRSTPLPSPVAAPAPMSTDGTVDVRPGDTLTGIAARLTGGDGAQQMMVGLYQTNPEAFGGNMSVLRSGAVLRVPDSTALSAISAGEASAEVRRQYAAWRGQAGAPSGAAAGADSGADEPGRLRLVPPSQAGTGAGSPDAAAAAEVRDLQKKVSDLQGQIAERDRLLDVRNKELADLQARLAAAGAPVPQADTPTPPPATDAAAGDVSADALAPPAADAAAPDAAATTPDASAAPDATAPDSTAADTAPPPAVEPAPTPQPTPAPAVEEEGPSFVSTLMGFWYIPVLLLVALAGLFGYRKWKERGDTEFDDSLGRMADFGAETIEKRSGSPTPRGCASRSRRRTTRTSSSRNPVRTSARGSPTPATSARRRRWSPLPIRR
jgi:pilus assembly protein FimV